MNDQTYELLQNGVSLVGTQVIFSPLKNHEDFQILYAWHNDPQWLFLWSPNRRLLPFPDFMVKIEKWLKTHIDVWLIVKDKTDSTPLGFVYSYDTSVWDSYTFVCVYLDAKIRGSGLGREAGAIFVKYLFDYYPFRKIYADVFEYNQISQTFVKDYGFVEEGFFPKHRYYKGKYWGLSRLALYRQKWEELENEIFTKIKLPTPKSNKLR